MRPHTPLNADEIETLEMIIDRTSLKSVLLALEDMAYAKADNIETNWQDKVTARPWIVAAQHCGRAMVKVNC